MNRIVLALVAMGALALAGCQPVRRYQLSQTSSQGWGQIAQGAGQVIGETKYDAKVAKASEELGRYCGALRAVAMGATLFAPEKHRALAAQASAAVNSVCDNPPSDVATALSAAAKAYEAVLAAGKASGVSVQSGAAALAAKGWIDDSGQPIVVAFIMWLIPTAWGLYVRRKAGLVASAAAVNAA